MRRLRAKRSERGSERVGRISIAYIDWNDSASGYGCIHFCDSLIDAEAHVCGSPATRDIVLARGNTISDVIVDIERQHPAIALYASPMRSYR